MSLTSVRKRFREIAAQLDAPNEYSTFRTKAQHDGSWHCEYDGKAFYYILTERGVVCGKRTTNNEDTILFWIVSDMAVQMAIDHERSNRIPGTDGRRIWFPYHIDLLRQISDKWAKKQEREYAAILKDTPYEDG